MAPDPRERTSTEEARGSAGRTGQSLGQMTEERGDPSGKRLDLDEPTTAPLQDSNMEEGNAEGESETGGAIASSPEASDQISKLAKKAGFPEDEPVPPSESKGTGLPPGSVGANQSTTQRPL
jgi:hypothetical protein